MKKLLCVAIVLLAAFPLAFSQGKKVTLRAFAPVDFGGRITFSAGNTDTHYDTNMGLGLGGEAMFNVWKGLKVGGGVQFLFYRGIDDSAWKDASFGFVPIYGLAAYGVDLGVVNPYAITRLGYNFHTGNSEYEGSDDLTGGTIFTIGAGASFKVPGWMVRPFLELNYANDTGGFDKANVDVSYHRFQTCLGVAFTM